MESDLEMLEIAMRRLFQTMKRPQTWVRVTTRSGVSIDRPSAVILKSLLTDQAHCRIQDLAGRLGIEAPSITRKTQELERAGYLKRVPDKDDRRAIDLHITPRGKTVANRLWKAQREIIEEALASWQPSERKQFVKLFQRFSNDLVSISVRKTSVKTGRAASV